MSNKSKKQVAEVYKATVEVVTETATVAVSCVTHTPAIVKAHAKRVSSEMDDIFAELLK